MIIQDLLSRVTRWAPCAVLAVLAGAAGLGLVRETMRPLALPPMPIAADAPPPAPLMVLARGPLSGPVETAQYAVIAIRNLFSASRGEPVEPAAATASGPRPFLHGVVLDGPQSRAYLEEPDSQRVFGYAVGDTVGGGKLVRIMDDRVVIQRRDGLMEIMLKDPAKPQPAPNAATPGAPSPNGAPASPEGQAPAPAPQGTK